MICPAGEYCREEACHRIPPGKPSNTILIILKKNLHYDFLGLYTITSEDLALPCEMSNLPGAAYCNLGTLLYFS